MDLTAVYLLLLPAALYLRALRVLERRGYRVPPLQSACWFGGLTLIGIALLSPLDRLGETDLLSAHMAQHLLIGDLAAPSDPARPALPRLRLPAAAPAAGAARPLRPPAAAVPVPAPALGGGADLDRDALRLAPSLRLRGGAALPRPARAPAPDLRRRVAAGLAFGSGARPPARARRAVEDRPHHRRAIRGHVPGHGIPDRAAPDLRRLLRQPRARARPHADSRTSRSPEA